MRILFVHKSFPGQFRYLLNYFMQADDCQVAFLTEKDVIMPKYEKVIIKKYTVPEKSFKSIHHYNWFTFSAVLYGQAALQAAAELKKEGFVPDIIVGHSGWGPMLYLQELFPKAKMLYYFEWFYKAEGSTHGFDKSILVTEDNRCEIRSKNVNILVDLAHCKAGITPTLWQKTQFPQEYHDKINVIHDGVDMNFFAPDKRDKLILPRIKLNLSDVEDVVTYVATGMEAMRGFPQFMRAVSLLQKMNKKCHVVVVGENRVEYSNPLRDGHSPMEKELKRNEFDLQRLHFTGRLGLEEYRTVIRNSKVHVYLSYPFILSWSMLEVMALGGLIVGSATPPLQEVIKNGENGFLVDFFDSEKIARCVASALEGNDVYDTIRRNAQQTILTHYELNKMLNMQIKLLQNIVCG